MKIVVYGGEVVKMLSNGVKNPIFGPGLHDLPYSVHASSKGSGENVWMHV